MPPLIRRHRMVDKLRTAVALSVGFVLIFAGDAPASDRCETGLPLLFQAKQRDLKNGYAIYREEYRAPAGHWEGRIHYDCLHHQGVALGRDRVERGRRRSAGHIHGRFRTGEVQIE